MITPFMAFDTQTPQREGYSRYSFGFDLCISETMVYMEVVLCYIVLSIGFSKE